jgi:hypothetical protein
MTHEQQPPPSAPRPTSPPARARLTVWHSPPPDQPGRLTVELAQRMLDEHTQAGQVVIDLDDDPGLPGIAAATDRGHHALDGHTDPDVIARYTAGADLLLMRWPRPATNPRHLLQTAHILLKDAGLLAIVIHVPAANRTAHLVALTSAAHNVGFHLLRHIVAIAPTEDIPGRPTRGQTPHPHTELLILEWRQRNDSRARGKVGERGGQSGSGTPVAASTSSPPDTRTPGPAVVANHPPGVVSGRRDSDVPVSDACLPPGAGFPMTPEQRRTRARIAAHSRWMRPLAREEQAQAARDALWRRFENEVDPDQRLDSSERRRLAESAARRHSARMHLARLLRRK